MTRTELVLDSVQTLQSQSMPSSTKSTFPARRAAASAAFFFCARVHLHPPRQVGSRRRRRQARLSNRTPHCTALSGELSGSATQQRQTEPHAARALYATVCCTCAAVGALRSVCATYTTVLAAPDLFKERQVGWRLELEKILGVRVAIVNHFLFHPPCLLCQPCRGVLSSGAVCTHARTRT